MKTPRRQFIASLTAITSAAIVADLRADDPVLAEPVHRVANAAASLDSTPAHPLDRALDIARAGLAASRTGLNDYTALLIRRERVDGVLGQHEYMSVKIRNRKLNQGQIVQPLSAYVMALKPSTIKGREVIYVENQNDGKLIAHEGGFKGKFLPTVTIPTDGMLAMRGQKYPITEIGVENLIVKLIERGEQARKFPDVQCEFRKNAHVKDRVCTVIEVTQPTKHPELEFFKAQIFIDDELNIPIRYIAYDWPARKGGQLEVLEEYNYLDLKINVGLTNADFDPRNPAYNFYSK